MNADFPSQDIINNHRKKKAKLVYYSIYLASLFSLLILVSYVEEYRPLFYLTMSVAVILYIPFIKFYNIWDNSAELKKLIVLHCILGVLGVLLSLLMLNTWSFLSQRNGFANGFSLGIVNSFGFITNQTLRGILKKKNVI